MLPTDVFFADVENVIATFTEADRPRLRQLITELTRIAERVPRVADRCFAYQARLYAMLHEYERAVTAVNQALELMPLDDSLLILRGDIHRQAEEYTQALTDYADVIEARPDSVTARVKRADLRQTLGDPQTAFDDISAALRLEPRSMRLLYRRGLILVELRRTAEAIKDFHMVAQLSVEPALKHKALERLKELGEQ
jgi:tetratricopeptide (TPR) repeat protein